MKRIFEGRIVTLDVGEVELPNGARLTMERVGHPGGAAVVALDADGRVCLLRQYRPAIDEWLWELPAGKIDHGEPPLETAQRELAEETGIRAQRWEELGEAVSSPGVFTERLYLYFASGLGETESGAEPHEVFEVHWVPYAEALRRARDGEIIDAKTVIALFRAEKYT